MKKQSKKEEIIELVVGELFSNVWKYESYLKDLVREVLKTKTTKELKKQVYG